MVHDDRGSDVRRRDFGVLRRPVWTVADTVDDVGIDWSQDERAATEVERKEGK